VALLTTAQAKWARKESALTEAEQAAIATHGLFDLSTFLPKKPGDVELKVIKEMFEASVDGQPYDTERWGQYFRPAGVQAPGGAGAAHADEDTTHQQPSLHSKWQHLHQQVTLTKTMFLQQPHQWPSLQPGQNAQDILAMIRSRQAK
jgi:hypothetical protein